MDRAWMVVVGLAAVAAVALAVVIVTPDGPVPVVTFDDDTERVDLQRALESASARLERDPSSTVADLAAVAPQVVGIEGREPAGAAFAVGGVLAAILGALIVRRAANTYGWYILAFGGIAVVLGLARAVADLAVHRGSTTGAVPQLAFAIADTFWIPLGVVLGPVLLLRLPNGQLLSRRWAVGQWIAVAASVALSSQLAHPLRYDGRALASYDGLAPGTVHTMFVPGVLAWQAALLVATASVIIRYRRAVGAELRQLRWVAFGVTGSIALLAVSDVAQRLGGDPSLWGPVGTSGFVGLLPACLAVAVLRFRLFSIDVVINRTLVHGVSSVLVAVVYVAAIGAAGAVLGVGATPAALLAMLLVALAFEPLHAGVLAVVERYVWRRDVDARHALTDVVTTVARPHDRGDALQKVLIAVTGATNAVEVSLRRLRGRAMEVLAIEPPGASPTDLDRCDLVIEAGNEAVLVVCSRPGDRVRRAERTSVVAIATLCGLLLDLDRTREELDVVVAALERERSQLAEAEQRLQTVISRTRVAVERDLHDGAQARAVALAASVGLIRAAPGHVATDSILDAIDATEDAVRVFAHGLYPELLRERGLAAALEEQASAVLPQADVHMDVGELPTEIAAVAYLVATEAMVNVAKHAPGVAAVVECRTEGGQVVVTVRDRGPGMPAHVASSRASLGTIRERATALGGHVRLDTGGRGTSVCVTIPVDAP